MIGVAAAVAGRIEVGDDPGDLGLKLGNVKSAVLIQPMGEITPAIRLRICHGNTCEKLSITYSTFVSRDGCRLLGPWPCTLTQSPSSGRRAKPTCLRTAMSSGDRSVSRLLRGGEPGRSQARSDAGRSPRSDPDRPNPTRRGCPRISRRESRDRTMPRLRRRRSLAGARWWRGRQDPLPSRRSARPCGRGRSGLLLDRETERQLESMTRQVEAAERRDARARRHARVELQKRHLAPLLVVQKLQAADPGIVDVLEQLGAPLAHRRRRRRRDRRDGRPEPLRRWVRRLTVSRQRSSWPSLATRWRLCRRPST